MLIRPAGRRPAAWKKVTRDQAGVISRPQALDAGLSARQVDWLLASGRWVRLHRGVYVCHTGPLTPLASVWGALLLAGDGAVAGGRTALWLWGVLDEPPQRVTVCVPAGRTPCGVAGVEITRRRDLHVLVHPAAQPPRLRVEEAVLDVADAATRPEQVVDVVVRAVQRRLTTAERLRDHLSRRSRHRWRRVLALILEDVVVGVRSRLEREYKRAVESPHGLPAGRLNPLEPVVERRRETQRYRDVQYEEFRLVVELDGAETHPPEERHREHRRDNAVAASGRSSLRYGWREVLGEPCLLAEEVAESLRVRGWEGRARPCGPACPLNDPTVADRPHPDV